MNAQLVGQGRCERPKGRQTRRGKKKKVTQTKQVSKHRVTQPPQSARVRRGAIDLAGNRATQLTKNRACNTTVSNSRWASQRVRRPVPRFGGLFHSLYRPSCCCYASLTATPLPPLSPLWVQRSLRLLRSFYLKRSSFCYLLLLRTEPAMPVPLCRFLDPSEPLTLLVRCQHPVFRFGGQGEQP